MRAMVRKVEENDTARVREFAEASGVSTDGIDGGFYKMEGEGQQLLAVAAVDPWEDEALLRSLVIDTKQCGMPEVIRFFDVLISEAEQSGIRALYLFTPSPQLFESFGFVKLMDEGIPERLKQMKDDNAAASMMCCSFA